MQCGRIWSHCIEVRQDRQRATFLCLGEKRAHAGGKWRKTLFKVKNYELAVSLNPNESWILFFFRENQINFYLFVEKSTDRFPPV